MLWFIKERYIIDAWKGSEYCSGSEYTKILNMPGLHKILKKCCTQMLDRIPNIPQVANMAGF